MTASQSSGPSAVLLDRDGILNVLVATETPGICESPLSPEDVVLIPDAAACIRRLRTAGYLVGCVTNQPAAAKGQISMDQLKSVHRTVVERLSEQGATLDCQKICPHHPAGTQPELTRICECRKPLPGLLLAASADLGVDPANCWVIGDTDADIVAGRRAGMKTILVETPGTGHKRTGSCAPDLTVMALSAAVDHILGDVSGRRPEVR